MWKTLITLFSLVCLTFAQQNQVTISLFATDLFGCDATSACDTVVTIYCDTKECGKTAQISDDAYPIFPEQFNLSTENSKWRFDVVDKDVLIDDPIGSVTVTVADFLASTSVAQPTIKLDLNGRGFLYVQRKSF